MPAPEYNWGAELKSVRKLRSRDEDMEEPLLSEVPVVVKVLLRLIWWMEQGLRRVLLTESIYVIF